jgi:hypothetical protein
MVQFAQAFADETIVATLSRQLSWSHVVASLPLKSAEARLHYVEQATQERWSVSEQHRQIEAFILELDHGFTFVERQKRMVIDGNHSLSQARWCGIRKCPGGWPLPGCPYGFIGSFAPCVPGRRRHALLLQSARARHSKNSGLPAVWKKSVQRPLSALRGPRASRRQAPRDH